MIMSKGVSLALVGASGVVGTKILQLLEKRAFPIDQFIPLGNSTVGSSIQFNDNKYLVESLESFKPEKAQLIIFSAGSNVADKYARDFVAAGSFVIDLSSNFRYQDDVPLIIPEINREILKNLSKPSLIANPNCSTAQLLVILNPIHNAAKIEILNIATYQAVSGTGKAALEELHNQTYFTDSDNQSSVYPKQIAFNLIPHCDVFLENNFTKEENKMVEETQKILKSKIEIFATCVRVPVFVGHAESVYIETEKNINLKKLFQELKNFKGISLVDKSIDGGYVTPDESAGEDDVFLSRIRLDLNKKNAMGMWVVADNLRKGAALNTVQIAELLIDKIKIK